MKKIMFNDKYGQTKDVLEGRKTNTRDIITCPQTFKGQYVAGFHVYKRPSDGFISEICMYNEDERDFDEGQIIPKYKVGEIVAVAQSYKNAHINFIQCDLKPNHNHIWGHTPNMKGWSNKMLVQSDVMPHQIRITNVRIERLQDISDEDCLKEGVRLIKENIISQSFGFEGKYEIVGDFPIYDTPQEAYAHLTDKINGKGTWESNPYVFVYDFKLIK